MAFIDLAQVDIVEEISEDAKILVEDGGEIKRIAHNQNNEESLILYKKSDTELEIYKIPYTNPIKVIDEFNNNNHIYLIDTIESESYGDYGQQKFPILDKYNLNNFNNLYITDTYSQLYKIVCISSGEYVGIVILNAGSPLSVGVC